MPKQRTDAPGHIAKPPKRIQALVHPEVHRTMKSKAAYEGVPIAEHLHRVLCEAYGLKRISNDVPESD